MHTKLIKLLADIEAGSTIVRVDLTNCDLIEFPVELYKIKDTLEILNLGNNYISTLPEDIGVFVKLRILFFGQNDFQHIPAYMGNLKSLKMISFKSNKVETIHHNALNPSINWLILSDNKIKELPSSIGQLTTLRKLMLAGNHLTSLPDELQYCTELELVRISANQLTSLPAWLFHLPRLSWLAYSGNPLMNKTEELLSSDSINAVNKIEWSELQVLERLGEGASGFVHRATWKDDSNVVAVKLFKGDTTSDGLPEYEMNASEAIGQHPNFIPVLGRLTSAPNDQLGLVFPLIDAQEYKILGNPPSFDTITRDTFDQGRQFDVQFILYCLKGIASAAQHLHNNVSLMHGDLYAHNILINESGEKSYLTDFGAASFKNVNQFNGEELKCLERMEVRAFGCLIDDLLNRISGEDNIEVKSALLALQSRCFDLSVLSRPSFSEIVNSLSLLN